MIAIEDPEKEGGHNSTTAMVGKRGDLMEMVAHVAAHPEGKELVNVLTDGLMLGLIMKSGPKDK